MTQFEWVMVGALVVAYFSLSLALVVLVAGQTARWFGAQSTPSILWVVGTILCPWLVAPMWLIWDGFSTRRPAEHRG